MQNSQQNLDTPVFAEMLSFLAVADELSFSRAAGRLGRDATVLSRRIRSLEKRIGVRLFERTTRSVALTEAGRGYLIRVRSIVHSIDQAEREAAAHAIGEPQGHLRLAVPTSFGRLWLAPLIAKFLAAHPRITLEAEFSNRFVDVIDERFDLAVRLGELTDSRLVARKLCARQRLLCAAPSYLKRAGIPAHPDDLARHACLVFSGMKYGNRWEMVDAQGVTTRVAVSGQFVSDDAEALSEAALAGIGIFLATDWLVGRALHAGTLVPVLTGWTMLDEGAVYVVTPSGAGTTTKTRVFSDWLITAFARPPWQAQRPIQAAVQRLGLPHD